MCIWKITYAYSIIFPLSYFIVIFQGLLKYFNLGRGGEAHCPLSYLSSLCHHHPCFMWLMTSSYLWHHFPQPCWSMERVLVCFYTRNLCCFHTRTISKKRRGIVVSPQEPTTNQGEVDTHAQAKETIGGEECVSPKEPIAEEVALEAIPI